MKKSILTLCLVLFSSPVWAGLIFSPGFSYIDQKNEANTPAINNEQNEMRLDMRLGYVLPSGLYLGGMYALVNSGDELNDSDGNLIGASVGYYSLMGFYTFLTYHLMGEVGDTTKFTGGKGPQIDVGWVFPITAYFALGPQFTYRSIEFDEIETGGVTSETDYKQTTIAPYLSLWFMF